MILIEGNGVPGAVPRNSQILVVDNERDILKLLARAFPIYGIDVLTADNGRTAVEAFRQHRDEINLILLDVQMIGWDGVRTLVELRCIDPAVNVAFMSATPDPISRPALLKLGVTQVFEKPFLSLKFLAETVKELIEKDN